MAQAMGCREIEEVLTEFLDGGLPAQPAAEVREHLAGCARCAAARDDLRAALALVHADVVPEPPAGTWERFAADVREKIRLAGEAEAAGRPAAAQPPPRRTRSGLPRPAIWERLSDWLRFAPFPPLAAATAAAVLVAIGVLMQTAPPGRPFDPGRDLALAQDLEVLRDVDRPEDLDVIERLPALLAMVRRGA